MESNDAPFRDPEDDQLEALKALSPESCYLCRLEELLEGLD